MNQVQYKPEGLSTSEATKRLFEVGENRLQSKKKTGPLKIFLGQFRDLMVIILLISTVLSVLMGEIVESIAIIIIVFVNALMGFIQEYRTEKTLEALKNMAAPNANVLRDGQPASVPADEVVPGDILVLKAGDRIAADAIIVDCAAMACDESLISGESVPVEKSFTTTPGDTASQNELNTIYMGTTVTKGRGKAMVVRTGMESEMGKIAGMLDEIEEDLTPLQKHLDQLGKYVAVGCLLICAIVSLAGIMRGEDIFNMIITGISLAVAAVPEGLPAIVTISLALAVNRILKRNALVRKLHAVETLGCASVICSDKTGTLTENKMTVKELVVNDQSFEMTGNGYERQGGLFLNSEQVSELPSTVKKFFEIAAYCNNAFLGEENTTSAIDVLPKELFGWEDNNQRWKASGEPTEIALMIAAAKAGVRTDEAVCKRVKENPFDSTRKMMSVVVEGQNGRQLLAKGAPDILMGHCASVLTDKGIQPMTDEKRQAILAQNDQMAERAMRVLALAYRELPQSGGESEDNLVFAGLAGMIDPPRKEAYEAVQMCRKAKIRPIMITGDHKLTACAIAKDLGILRPRDLVYTGAELDEMDDRSLDLVIDKAAVFARVNPGHKLRIVRALKNRGEIVAMTGDGVNDAPAIKEANIGVAMGISGTDVTKEASSIVLLDDNFATLVSAVEEGRTIYANIRRFIRYLLSCNIGEVLTMFLGMLMGMPVVLLPIQILLVNLVTDGLPAIALGFEPPEKDVMDKKPRSADDTIFANGLLGTIVFRGCLIGLTTLGVFSTFYRMYNSLALARTGALIALIMAQLFHVFECKSETRSLFEINPFSNLKLLLATLFSAGVAFATLYHPALQMVFRTVPLDAKQLLIILGFCMVAPIISTILMHLKPKKKLDETLIPRKLLR